MSDRAEFKGFENLIAAMLPRGRRMLAKKMAQDMRARKSDAILKNIDADGKSMEPRIVQKRSRKKGRMFQKLGRRTQSRMKATADYASVSPKVGNQNIARVHQFGLRSNVSKSVRHKYAERALYGFNDSDREHLQELLFSHVEEAIK